MSLKSKFISGFASALVVGSMAAFAVAQDTQAPVKEDNVKKERGFKKFGKRGGPHRKGGHKFRGGKGFHGIELTDAQKEQIKQIHQANRPDQATMDELKAIHQAKRAGTITEDQKARAQTLREQAKLNRQAVQQQIDNILTPEQKQQIETRKAERMTKMKERREMHSKRKQKKAAETPTDNQ